MKMFGETHGKIVGLTFAVMVIGIILTPFKLPNIEIIGMNLPLGFWLFIISGFGLIFETCGLVMILGTASMIFPNHWLELNDE